MDERDIFDIVDSFEKYELIDVIDEEFLESLDEKFLRDLDENDVDNKIKEKIKSKLNYKICENEVNRDKLDKKFDSYKKYKKKFNNKWIKGTLGVAVAMFIFVAVVNFCPNITYALEKIPGIETLVRIVKRSSPKNDRGFKNLIDGGNYQNINKSYKKDDIEFTINSIVGDNSKLWISYNFSESQGIIADVKFKDSNNNELPWSFRNYSLNGYMEIDLKELVRNFTIVLDIYRTSDGLNEKVSEMTEKEIEYEREKAEKDKVVLSFPIELSDEIFNGKKLSEYKLDSQFTNQLGSVKFEKLEVTESRSRLYFKLDNEKYTGLRFDDIRLIDSNNKIYFCIDYKNEYGIETNGDTLVLEFDGGITNIDGLRLVCDDIYFINKEDEVITIDLNKRLVEENNFNLSLNNIEGNKLTLNIPDEGIELSNCIEADGNRITYVTATRSYGQDGKYEMEFQKLNYHRLEFKVIKDNKSKVDGFDIKLMN